VNSIKVREELKDKLALERFISHADIRPNVYRRLVKRGYIKGEEITDKGTKLIASA
jgi:hypothetical protein